MKKKTAEKWSVDKLGFVSNGKQCFHHRDIICVGMEQPDTVVLHISFVRLVIKFPNQKDAKGLFKWFCGLMAFTEQNRIKHHKEHHALQNEVIKINKKLLSGCKHK